MREHLYRAKSIDTDEWVFGTYHYSADGKYHYILNREKLLYREPQEWALHSKEVNEVDPETVGAFTGLLDKNGKKIFEGDKLQKLETDWDKWEEIGHDMPEPLMATKTDVATMDRFPVFWLVNERFGYEGDDLEEPNNWEIISTIHD